MFLNRLRVLRDNAELTQRELADLMGVSRSVYSKIETGQQEPTLSQLIALAKIFNTTTDFILNVDDRDDSGDCIDLLQTLEGKNIFVENHLLTEQERLKLFQILKILFN